MKILKENEEKQAIEYLLEALKIGLNSTCQRAKCGSIIVKNNEIIGVGFNSPPKNIEEQRRCSFSKYSYHKKVVDKTCCIHAEQRAIIDTLKRNPDKISDSRIYFIRIDEDNNPVKTKEPYCTICSKMALDVGIKEFVLWQEKGVVVYNTEEYNMISYKFGN